MRLKEDVARDIEEHLQTHNVTKPVVGYELTILNRPSARNYPLRKHVHSIYRDFLKVAKMKIFNRILIFA